MLKRRSAATSPVSGGVRSLDFRRAVAGIVAGIVALGGGRRGCKAIYMILRLYGVRIWYPVCVPYSMGLRPVIMHVILVDVVIPQLPSHRVPQ